MGISRADLEEWRHLQRMQVAFFFNQLKYLLETQKNMAAFICDTSIAFIDPKGSRN